MQEIQRIAAVNDLSGFGRCALTVSLPVLSAMGFQVCPVPTAVLSAHTGYPNPHIRDFTDDMEAYLSHWERLGLTFACGYTNGANRYIPAAFCWNNGGYEVKSCFFECGTGEKMARHHIDKLWELYRS